MSPCRIAALAIPPCSRDDGLAGLDWVVPLDDRCMSLLLEMLRMPAARSSAAGVRDSLLGIRDSSSSSWLRTSLSPRSWLSLASSLISDELFSSTSSSVESMDDRLLLRRTLSKGSSPFSPSGIVERYCKGSVLWIESRIRKSRSQR